MIPLWAAFILQVLLSWVLVRCYGQKLGFDNLVRRMVWLHTAGVAFAWGLGLLFWATAQPSDVGASDLWMERLIPTLFAAGLIGLNLFYGLQILVVQVWGEPLKPALIPTLWPQLRSLVAAVGRIPYLVLIGIALIALGLIVSAWILGPALHAVFHWPEAVSAWVRLHVWHGIVFLSAGITLLLELRRRGYLGTWQIALYYDTILSFWLWSEDQRFTSHFDFAAEERARASYPITRPDHPRPNVIIITMDCWRWDHLSATGYHRPTTPFLAELMATGRLHHVERAVAVSNSSRHGIMGILASRQLESIHTQNFRLHDILHQQGYRTHFLVSGDHSSFENLRACYGPKVDVFRDGLSPAVRFTVNDDRNLIDAVEQLPAADDRPHFFYLHLMTPHDLGVLKDESIQWPTPHAKIGVRQRFDGATGRVDSYDNKVLQADHHLRRIFATLEARGYLENAITVLTADHGQSLGEHGKFGHRLDIHESEIRIPLFFMESGDFDYGTMPFASQVDIAPTLLDRLGLPRPATWAGNSLLRQPPQRAFYTCASALPWTDEIAWSGFTQPDDPHCWKYLFRTDSSGRWQERLFDLAIDPGELHDLAAEINAEFIVPFREIARSHRATALPSI